MISVIVPVYNALDDVKKCLNSLIENFDFKNGEIIVINDYSDTQTTEFLKQFSKSNPLFTIEHNEENLGFVKTCNKGMRIAKGNIIVLLNSDTKIPSGFCEKIEKCFASDPKIGVASPIASYSPLFYIRLPWFYSLEKMNKKLIEKHSCQYPLIPSAEGFCFCIRKAVIEQQGYLDEIYGKGYHEEIDFSYRAITNGWNIVLIDNLYVYHKRNASFGKLRKTLMKKNDAVFIERWKAGAFRTEYEKKINFVNPIIQIKQELFPIKSFFTFQKNKIGRERSITFLGQKIHYTKK